MNIQPMRSTPTTREQFERNLFLLAETMKNGKLRIAGHLYHSIRGIQRVRKLPNSRIDFLSVDEMVRVMANTFANLQFESLEPNARSQSDDATGDTGSPS